MSATTEHLEELVRASVRAEIDVLSRFLDRRIAELSMEIHATVQLVDYSETNLSAKLATIHEQIARVVAPPAAATYNPKAGSWMIACVGRIGRTVGDGPIAASASASPG